MGRQPRDPPLRFGVPRSTIFLPRSTWPLDWLSSWALRGTMERTRFHSFRRFLSFGIGLSPFDSNALLAHKRAVF